MVCCLPLLCDCTIVVFHRNFARSLKSLLNRQFYGKDLCKWRCAGSEPAAQRE